MAGDIILHKKFGKGEVLKVLGKGTDTEIHVQFQQPYGNKRMLAAFAPIHKIG
ncbi:ATP-dependent DNA helicase PcrA [compost metagenome]